LNDIHKQHVDLAMKAAYEIEETLLNVTPQKTCEELETMVGSIVRNIKEKYRVLKTEYESSTNYGRRAGLSLM
jgi:predicted secreted Zn-dependent protease